MDGTDSRTADAARDGGKNENRIEARLYACKLGIYPVVRQTIQEATN
ncbi:hypothetical protein [Pseudomonas oryzihabitans]|uniref:Uncharacterized protein n=1 Tax=Pseudomonas oryzihabitans TaxID=47885 RepID=A0AAJ2BSZ7_9PSED|nr:hypothetical protein [Pseudomonas psychrotolerans]MDR6235792.1 hypothetical protein [Pseudomonas psychrotolerans]MDR6354929.1 hypothetical protein [Pseudomonas psychrotolerans]MDR6679779.1 hypothetical protein [Pseudomonas psychrotolerans]